MVWWVMVERLTAFEINYLKRRLIAEKETQKSNQRQWEKGRQTNDDENGDSEMQNKI